ncbi:sensor histidine kinase [Pseudorhodoplanes sp.]|uniref:sensor histidine kinase n=1 Tax=Pseudorhodoplanes sp. TaxID=1934341 RepID=UPI003D116890
MEPFTHVAGVVLAVCILGVCAVGGFALGTYKARRDREHLVHRLGERVKELGLLHATARLLQRDRPLNSELLNHLVGLLPPAWQYPECCEARIIYGDVEVSTPGWRDSQWKQSATFTTTEGTGLVEVAYLAERPTFAEGPFLAEERALLESFTEMLVTYLEVRRHHEHLEALVASRTAELRTLEQLRDDLVHMIVHDMRSPRSVLLMRLSMLQRPVAMLSDDKPKEYLRTAIVSVGVLNQMINDLLDVSRLEAGKMPVDRVRCDLTRIADEVRTSLREIAREREIDVESAGPAEATCDGAIIRRILENLVGNAIKHTPAGSHVRISISKRDGLVRVEVQDEGDGVPEEAREKIFEKFVTIQNRRARAYRSAGLGLAFCKLAIEAHEGAIGVDPRTPHGSTFWFELRA